MKKLKCIKINNFDVKCGDDLYAIKFEDAIEFAKIKDGTLLEIEVNDEYMEIQTYRVLSVD